MQNFQNKKRIVFLSRMRPWDHFIEFLGSRHYVSAFYDPNMLYPEYNNVQIIPVHYKSFGIKSIFKKLHIETSLPFYISNFNSILEEIQPDVLVVPDFFRLYFWQSIKYKKTHPDCKIVLWSQTKAWPKNPISNIAMRFFAWYFKKNQHYVDKTMVFTKQGSRFFSKHFPKVETQIFPTPINNSVFFPDPNKKFMADGVLRILMSARYTEYKRHKDMLRAFKKLTDKGLNMQLFFIGRNGHLKNELQESVKKLNLSDCVTFFDPIKTKEEMRKCYQKSDISVLPSYNEAVGMAISEAMACGIPTITSDTVGANVYVKEGETGLIFKTGDVEDLVEKILEMYDVQKLTIMGQAAQKQISNFTIEKLSEKFEHSMI